MRTRCVSFDLVTPLWDWMVLWEGSVYSWQIFVWTSWPLNRAGWILGCWRAAFTKLQRQSSWLTIFIFVTYASSHETSCAPFLAQKDGSKSEGAALAPRDGQVRAVCCSKMSSSFWDKTKPKMQIYITGHWHWVCLLCVSTWAAFREKDEGSALGQSCPCSLLPSASGLSPATWRRIAPPVGILVESPPARPPA